MWVLRVMNEVVILQFWLLLHRSCSDTVGLRKLLVLSEKAQKCQKKKKIHPVASTLKCVWTQSGSSNCSKVQTVWLSNPAICKSQGSDPLTFKEWRTQGYTTNTLAVITGGSISFSHARLLTLGSITSSVIVTAQSHSGSHHSQAE